MTVGARAERVRIEVAVAGRVQLCGGLGGTERRATARGAASVIGRLGTLRQLSREPVQIR
jgi:hypothetical protein